MSLLNLNRALIMGMLIHASLAMEWDSEDEEKQNNREAVPPTVCLEASVNGPTSSNHGLLEPIGVDHSFSVEELRILQPHIAEFNEGRRLEKIKPMNRTANLKIIAEVDEILPKVLEVFTMDIGKKLNKALKKLDLANAMNVIKIRLRSLRRNPLCEVTIDNLNRRQKENEIFPAQYDMLKNKIDGAFDTITAFATTMKEEFTKEFECVFSKFAQLRKSEEEPLPVVAEEPVADEEDIRMRRRPTGAIKGRNLRLKIDLLRAKQKREKQKEQEQLEHQRQQVMARKRLEEEENKRKLEEVATALKAKEDKSKAFRENRKARAREEAAKLRKALSGKSSIGDEEE